MYCLYPTDRGLDPLKLPCAKPSRIERSRNPWTCCSEKVPSGRPTGKVPPGYQHIWTSVEVPHGARPLLPAAPREPVAGGGGGGGGGGPLPQLERADHGRVLRPQPRQPPQDLVQLRPH